AAGKGGALDATRLAVARGDSTRARTLLYALLARDPLSDDAAAGVSLALGPLPPRAAAEHVALARALNRRTTTRDARIHVEHALRSGDSSATTLFLYGELLVASGRLREAVRAYAAAARDSASRPLALYRRARVLVRLGDSTGPQRPAARFWLGKMAEARGDSTKARAIWVALAREDSVGYYGMRARRETGLPPLAFARLAGSSTAPPAVLSGLSRIDTLLLAGLDSEAQAEVRVVLAHPPTDLDALLAWSEGLGLRCYGSAGVRLGWQAALLAPGDVRVLRAI